MIKDYLKMAWTNLSHRKLRSWLTIIGIFVGIAAVVALISVGQGLQGAITQQFEELGTDLLIIQPKSAGPTTAGSENPALLTTEDEDVVSKTNGVLMTTTMVFRSARIEFKDEVSFQFVSGIPTDDPEKMSLAQRMATMDVMQGRNIDGGGRFNALAGFSYTNEDEVFSQSIRVGDKVNIEGQNFDIIGVLEKIGSPPDDRQMVLPMETADEVLDVGEFNGDKVRDYIVAKINPSVSPESVVERVERQLRSHRGLDEGDEDFQVQTAEQLLSSFNDILVVVQSVLVGIAGISLLVGGIGIMNTMYTAVVQRTKEIGIMKAVGAKNSDILQIFLIESGVLGLVGGAIGVTLGYLISRVVTDITAQFIAGDLTTFFPWWLVLGGLAFSFVIGAASGVLPAIQASRMDPVDSLRYE